ncbi:MAG TPA: sigma-70 family RNA polymerase sigma factor [Candidatus Cybelea sp.]|nr:sigma-70 family RNA polymerase sigma factor [Candidatus Cybelea sp.]
MALRFRTTPFRRLVPIARSACSSSPVAQMPPDREGTVVAYWYLCRRAARRFMRRGLDRADLEQVAAIGLIKAIDRYDRSQSAPFEAYAWLLVVGELMHYVRDSERFLRAPRGVRELERRWSAAERELWALLGREPRESDVAEVLDASPAEVREIRSYRATNHMISFEVLGNSEQRTPPCGIDDVLDRLTVERILAALTPLERQIVRSIHLDGVTVVELARRLGYSRRHVTRLHRAAIDRLKSSCCG